MPMWIRCFNKKMNNNLECFVLVVVDIFFFVGLFACDDMMLGISILSSFVQNFEA